MNHKIRIIKRGDRMEPELDPLEEPRPHPTRDITSTIKLWVSEFKERRLNDEHRARITHKLTITTASQT
jgi:hypothetical protein